MAEMKRRETEALRLYEPLEHLADFHSCWAPERVLRAGNRAGKTITAAIEFARCVTGQDPHGKYPMDGGTAIVVGATGRHLSDPLFKILFRPGALRMVKDEHGKFVLYKPWIHGRKVKTYPAAPLIPERFILGGLRGVHWISKKGSQPKSLRMKNGWEINFYTSEGIPPQGIKATYAWFDEEIIHPQWYTEIAARLVDDRGYFVWSATAQKGGLQFYELCEEGDRQSQFQNPRVVQFTSHISQNPYFDDEQRELFFGKLTEEEFRIRVEGQFAFDQYKVYSEYNDHLHLIPPFEIPDNWMRVMVVDPGRQVCAVLFAAVPPPNHNDPGAVYLYDELYIKACSAQMFGDEVRKKIHQQPMFYAFLIDPHGCKLRDIGSGESVELQYQNALEQRGIKNFLKGSGFLYGSDDVKGGIEKARSWLYTRAESGTPKLRVVFGKCPKFAWEIKRYRYKRDKDGNVQDEPDQRHNHLMDCFRYLAMFDPKYRAPKVRSPSGDIAAYVKKKTKKRKRQEAMSNELLAWI